MIKRNIRKLLLKLFDKKVKELNQESDIFKYPFL